MNRFSPSDRVKWALKQSVPVCAACTEAIGNAAAIVIESSGDLYFHTWCYDQEYAAAKKALSIFMDSLFGLRDFEFTLMEMDRIAPFRFFMPSRLNFKHEGVD